MIQSVLQYWQARRDSNPQPAVLETAALPVELLAYHYCIEKQISRDVLLHPTCF